MVREVTLAENMMTGGEKQDRRTALSWLIRGFLSLWGLGAAALGAAFLKAPESERRGEQGRVRCGALSTLAVGEARLVRHGAQPLYVVRTSASEVIALSAICTHMRCIITWSGATRTFLCPCHAGSFDRSGNVLSGPPKRALTSYPAEIRADEIVVRT